MGPASRVVSFLPIRRSCSMSNSSPFRDRLSAVRPSPLGMRVLLLCAALTASWSFAPREGQQNDPRLRRLLPSGAVVFAEVVPDAKYFCLQLFASSRGAKDTAETHGFRHLLEHLVTKGPDKGLEARLETQGVFLSAETQRDAMSFAFVGPPEKIDIAISAVRELLQPLRSTEKEIEQEVRIIAQEIALTPASKKLSRAAWLKSFGEEGLDPVGNVDAMSKATPSALELLRRRHFAPQNLVLSLAGAMPLETAIREMSAILPRERGLFEPDSSVRKAGVVSAVSGEGEAIGVPVPQWDEPPTSATLSAALALASERENCFVIYTPSVQRGLVLLGTEEKNSGFGDWLKNLKSPEIDALYVRGRLLAESWLRRYLDSVEGCAFLRGFLYSQSISATPDVFLEKVRALSREGFRAAVGKFQSGGAN